jgi:hypothetical protein
LVKVGKLQRGKSGGLCVTAHGKVRKVEGVLGLERMSNGESARAAGQGGGMIDEPRAYL